MTLKITFKALSELHSGFIH